MKITGLIVEYNPFHNGHLHHLEMARSLTGCDGVVAVMSGDFTQRGFPAIVDKYARTRMALEAGVDVVLELPVYHALGSAERFAAGAVGILHNLQAVNSIVYGCEATEETTGAGDAGGICPEHSQALRSIAAILANEPASFKEQLGSYLRQGYSFPAARAKAVTELVPGSEALLRSPNNILAIEYEKAIIRQGSSIRGQGIIRSDRGYLESGSDIRRAIGELDSPEQLAHLMPMTSALELTYNMDIDMFSELMNYRLLTLREQELTGFEDVSEDLAARIMRLKDRGYSLSEMTEHLTTRNITETRARRALLHILLGISRRSSSEYALPYVRVLGLRKNSRIMKELKNSSRLPLITKLADAPAGCWDEDDRATRIYNQVLRACYGQAPEDDYRYGTIVM